MPIFSDSKTGGATTVGAFINAAKKGENYSLFTSNQAAIIY